MWAQIQKPAIHIILGFKKVMKRIPQNDLSNDIEALVYISAEP